METKNAWIVFVLMLSPVIIVAWRDRREERRGIHYHNKRHMLTETEPKHALDRTSLRPLRESIRKKPSGHLAPLDDDDIEIDDVVSVAIGPPPMRPKFDKHRRQSTKVTKTAQPNNTVADLIRDILSQLGREFLTKDVSEDFVFGQYVGNSMRNLTSGSRLKMQHDILDVILKYQKHNSDVKKDEVNMVPKDSRIEKKLRVNDTDESWPDFTNLAKIVG